MSTPFIDESRSTVDFLVQTGLLVGFLFGAISFMYRYIKGSLDKSIENKVSPIRITVDSIHKTLGDMKLETSKDIKVKEEIDRERFRNLHNGQEDIKEKIKEVANQGEEVKKKVEAHLVDAAQFIGKTDTRLDTMEKALNNFRGFFRRHEAENSNNRDNSEPKNNDAISHSRADSRRKDRGF